MVNCTGIINLYYKSKMKCNDVTDDPELFVANHMHKQDKDIIYLYLFDGVKYLSIKRSEYNFIEKMDDPDKLTTLWSTYGQKAGNNQIDNIIDKLDEINNDFFESRYPITDKTKYKDFMLSLIEKYGKEQELMDIINLCITIVSTGTKTSNDLLDIIATIFYLLRLDPIGTIISVKSIKLPNNNFQSL